MSQSVEMRKIVAEGLKQLKQEKFERNVKEYKKLYKAIKEAELNLHQHEERMELFLKEKQYFSEDDVLSSASLNCMIIDCGENLK